MAVMVPGIVIRFTNPNLPHALDALLFGMAIVGAAAWWRWGKRGQPGRGQGVRLERSHSVEIAYLALATIYCLTLPLRHSITLIDAAVLISVFVLYTVRISRAPAEEPHLVGPA